MSLTEQEKKKLDRLALRLLLYAAVGVIVVISVRALSVGLNVMLMDTMDRVHRTLYFEGWRQEAILYLESRLDYLRSLKR